MQLLLCYDDNSGAASAAMTPRKLFAFVIVVIVIALAYKLQKHFCVLHLWCSFSFNFSHTHTQTCLSPTNFDLTPSTQSICSCIYVSPFSLTTNFTPFFFFTEDKIFWIFDVDILLERSRKVEKNFVR